MLTKSINSFLTMMIDKRLLVIVPESKKYVALNVLLKWISLISNIVLVFSVAQILRSKGQNIRLSSIYIALSLIVSFLCFVFSSFTSYKSSKNVKKTLRSIIYKKLLELGTEYQEKIETAKIVQLACEGVEQLEVWFGLYLPQFFYSIIASITLFFVISFLNFKMALVLLICVPLIPLSIVIVQKIAKKLLSKYWVQYSNLADNFLENLQGLTTLKVYNADEFKHKKMNEEAEHFRKVTMKVLSMQLNSIIVMDIVAYSGAALGIIFALNSFFEGNLSLENCFICILLSADFFIPLRRLGSFFHTAMNGTTAANKIFDLLNEASHGFDFSNEKSLKTVLSLESTNPCDNIKTKENFILLKNVSYNFDEKTVLKNVNLSIKKGELVSFVGKSGSGKSTTAKILCGINKNYFGNAQICGSEIQKIDRNDLYKNLIYISHRDWIFKGSVKDTLLEGNPNATEKEMWEVLEKVQLSDFVKENGGLSMNIQENAINLSGGQKQRLSIARALIHDSQILIFDEATSNIDIESEKAILNLIQNLKGSKTIIIISHRKENELDFDCVYNFENGEIV